MSNLIKNQLLHCVKQITSYAADYVYNPSKDFTRSRKLGFDQVLLTLLKRLIVNCSGLKSNRPITRYIKNFQSQLTMEVFIIYNSVVFVLPMANKPLEHSCLRAIPRLGDFPEDRSYIFHCLSHVS